MFWLKCSFVEWTDVTFFLNFNYFSTSQQIGIDIYFLTNPKQTNVHHSCQRRLAAQTAIFECSFNVFVLLLREQLMHLLVFSVWFWVHQYPNTKNEALVSQDETGKRNVSLCYWKILMIYIQNYCVGEFFCVLNWIWTVSHCKTWPLFPRESAVNNRLYFQQSDTLKCVQRTVLQKKYAAGFVGRHSLKNKTGFGNLFNILVLEQMKTQEEACQHL